MDTVAGTSTALSVVPFRYENLKADCVWPGGELVFPLREAGEILGVEKWTIKQARKRHPEIKSLLKVGFPGNSTFRSSVTEYGEVRLVLPSPGGPQEQVCLTHYGLFCHAIYIRTEKARRYVLAYPAILAAILSGAIRSPEKIAERYQYIFDAPPRHKAARVREVASEMHKSTGSVYRHLELISRGQVTPEGLPVMRQPGPPKGYGSKVLGWMREFLFEQYQKTKNKSLCYRALVAEFVRRNASDPLPSLSAVCRVL